MIFLQGMLNMLGFGLSTFIPNYGRVSYLLFVLFFIAYVIGFVYLLLYIGSDRTAEATPDQDAETATD